jgi:hypothetical protein
MRNDIKISLREALKLHEVSDDIHNIIQTQYPKGRIVMSYEKVINYRPTEQVAHPKHKPDGFWYGIGTEWIDWVRNNASHWENEYAFTLDVDWGLMLQISTYEELVRFTELYGTSQNGKLSMAQIHWDSVARDYRGIEIAPYIHKARMEVGWYYSWDVASGCLWGDNVISDIKKIGV